MYDPMIREIFPDRTSIPLDYAFSSSPSENHANGVSSYPTLEALFFPNSKYAPDYLKGDYDLSYSLSHYGKNFFPSFFTRKNLLYLQLLCSVTFPESHYTRRNDLSSYLLAQTFWGKGILRYEQREYELFPDDLFLIDCRNDHEYFADANEGWGYRFIHFDGASMPGYYGQIAASQNVKFTFHKDSRFQELLQELFLTNYNSEPTRDIITNRILTDMLTEILCQCPQYQETELPPAIADLCNFLQKSFREKLTLDQIAKEVRLSKYYMSREFKKYTGKTIFNYIIDCRIALAQRMLRYGDTPINEIAEHVGFEDHNGFYRAFQQRENMSPSAYRKYWKSF